MNGSQQSPGSVLARLASLQDTMTPGQRQAAEAVLADPSAASRLSIGELAAAAGTSEATVVRLATALGYSGYKEFRLELARADGARGSRDGAGRVTDDIAADDDLDVVVTSLLTEVTRALEDTTSVLDHDVVDTAAHAVSAARRVVVAGVGASGLVADDLAAKLTRIGLIAQSVHEVHEAITLTVQLGPEDCLVVVSASGTTAEIVEVLERGRERGAVTVAVTSSAGSPLRAAQFVLRSVAAHEGDLRPAAMASRVSQLFVVDVLFTRVAQLRFEQASGAIAATWAALRDRH